MYQFYYADKTKIPEHIQCTKDIHDIFNITAIRPAMWEEHCLECSAPLCFKSCAHYQSRGDGRCKRFDNGISTFSDERACCGQGAYVKFRKWGNMMTVLFPATLSENDYMALWKKNDSLGNYLDAIERSKLPRSVRWQAIRIPEYIRRQHLRKLRGQDNTAEAFVFHGYSYTHDDYNLIIEIYHDNISVWKTSIPIHYGENIDVITELSPECSSSGNLVKIYPENNIEAELDFLWCDFVKGSLVVADKPADKVKCLVWDLDNTLWSGTLIEMENTDSLTLKSGVREVIEEMDKRGIIQSVSSKNDFKTTIDVLKKLGIADYFLYPQISWMPKSDSIKRIAESLNIGIDSLSFIDDSVFERQQVSSALPQVRVYDASDSGKLLSLPEFDVPITEESRNRRAMYQAEEQRENVMVTEHTDILDFLRSCHLKLHIFEPVTHEEKLRCYELIVRTNQLNMSGKKYTSEEFEEIISRTERKNFAFSCDDDFGKYGIVGFGQYEINGDQLVFTEFAMSCRVAGKFVESALFSYLLKKENCEKGVFEVIKTKKNGLLRSTLEKIGFSVVSDMPEFVSYLFTRELLNESVVRVE